MNKAIESAVSLLQAALTLHHYDCGEIDGDFGPHTRTAYGAAERPQPR